MEVSGLPHHVPAPPTPPPTKLSRVLDNIRETFFLKHHLKFNGQDENVDTRVSSYLALVWEYRGVA